MTDRRRLDDLTSDQLDALYERLEAAEATIRRVRAHADQLSYSERTELLHVVDCPTPMTYDQEPTL